MNEATTISVDAGQKEGILSALHRLFKVVESGRDDGDIGDKWVGVGRGGAAPSFAVAYRIILSASRPDCRAHRYLPIPAAPACEH
jgi:hypothetical protein